MSDINSKRVRITYTHDGGGHYDEDFAFDPYGDYVQFEDYKELADALEQAQVRRETLVDGREHLTVTNEFQSDKYPWCPAGFVPIKVTDPMAADLLSEYADRRKVVDEEFTRDLKEALLSAWNPSDDADQAARDATKLFEEMNKGFEGPQTVPDQGNDNG